MSDLAQIFVGLSAFHPTEEGSFMSRLRKRGVLVAQQLVVGAEVRGFPTCRLFVLVS